MDKTADAEQAKSTGGMVALYPSAASAEMLVLDHPNAEPIDDLHLTLAYLGEDVRDLYSSVAAEQLVANAATLFPIIHARAMGHATFNPSGDEPCAVYLIGDNDSLPALHQTIRDGIFDKYVIPKQHTPWIPHVTGGYNLEAADLLYDGPVTFDLLVLKWAGEVHAMPLAGVI